MVLLPACASTGVDPHDIEDAEDLLESYFIQVSRQSSMAQHGRAQHALLSPRQGGASQGAAAALLSDACAGRAGLPAPQVDFILRRLLMVNERVDATEDLVSIKMDHRR